MKAPLGWESLTPSRLRNFEEKVDFVGNSFSAQGFPINGLVAQLHSTESERMLEAIHCLFEGCRYSAVAMAVSAIEFRLFEFMKQINPEASKLEKDPLGLLIKECLNNPDYSKQLPERHQPPLQLCNQFRVFSVHPKTEMIGQNEAMSAIYLAFSFILDSRVRKASATAFGA